MPKLVSNVLPPSVFHRFHGSSQCFRFTLMVSLGVHYAFVLPFCRFRLPEGGCDGSLQLLSLRWSVSASRLGCHIRKPVFPYKFAAACFLESYSQRCFSTDIACEREGRRCTIAAAGPSQRVASKLSLSHRRLPQEENKVKQETKPWEPDKLMCPGCGVIMQDQTPNAPGYFKRPAWMDRQEEEFGDEEGSDTLVVQDLEEDEATKKKAEMEAEKETGWTFLPMTKELEEWQKTVDGFRPVGSEYGNSQQARQQKQGLKQRSQSRSEKDGNEFPEKEAEKVVVCARCHSLRYYGRVKDEEVDNLLPDFDFDRTVGARLTKTHATRAVVLMVVDAADFDGSFPRKVVALLSEVVQRDGELWREHRPGNVPRLVMVVNKVDLLPGKVSQTRLEHWVRRRARAAGASRLSGLFLVSALKGWGMQALSTTIKEMAGPRGQIWVIGAQNAGKSSVINALGRVEGGKNITHLTEASIPGTTLGIIRVDGILPARAKLFDTPGLLHPHQITVRLNGEEQKMVQVRKQLKPRTYRAKVNDTIHVGGLARVDVKEGSSSSIYITVWASAFIPCHMGKIEKADENFERHVGDILQPPMSKERLEELGPWVKAPVRVEGNSWDRSSVDVVVAGLGWFGLGLKGVAMLDVWTYEGVAITVRDALLLDMASTFETPGFSDIKGEKPKVKSGKLTDGTKETIKERPQKKQLCQSM